MISEKNDFFFKITDIFQNSLSSSDYQRMLQKTRYLY